MTKKFSPVSLIVVVIAAGTFYWVSSNYLIQNAVSAEVESSDKAQAPAMSVEITVIEELSTRLWKEFSGRLAAVDYVEIRPQASGLITEVKFEDGQFVTQGDILYIIDPLPLKAIVAQESADLIVAKNRLALAQKEYKRSKNMLKKNMLSQRVYDERMNTKLVADLTVKRAEAELSEAKINLSYAYIKSPISGRVSRTELTVGNLVSAGSNAPLLTTIVSGERIYGEFEVDEQTYLNYIDGNSSEQNTRHANPVELRLQNSDTVYQGKIHSFDNRIDPTSGTIRARAIFDNPQGKLLPGMYARLKLGSVTEEKTIRVSERAIGTDQNRKFVYVVNADNKATYREVQLGNGIDGDRIVHSGLMVGDKVIVRGLMRIQPNMQVNPKIPVKEKIKADKL